MPRIEEVLFTLEGLWLMLSDPRQGESRLDGSLRGFLRSFWAFAYCLPPILLSWASYRRDYLAAAPKGTVTGVEFFAKLAVLEMSVWIIPLIAIGAIMAQSSHLNRSLTVLVAFNWLSVPIHWLMSICSIIALLSSQKDLGFVLIYLAFSLVAVTVQFFILNALLEKARLLVSTLLLANFVISLFVGWKMQLWLGLV